MAKDINTVWKDLVQNFSDLEQSMSEQLSNAADEEMKNVKDGLDRLAVHFQSGTESLEEKGKEKVSNMVSGVENSLDNLKNKVAELKPS